MAEELEVKEITELNDVSFTDESLVLAYTESDGIGKTTFANAKAKCCVAGFKRDRVAS